MTLIHRSMLATLLIFTVSSVSYADSLRCSGKIIKRGYTEQQVLDACGQPTSVDGGNWLYEKPGSQPVVVTIGRGVVTFIRSKHESGAFGEHPYGDRP